MPPRTVPPQQPPSVERQPPPPPPGGAALGGAAGAGVGARLGALGGGVLAAPPLIDAVLAKESAEKIIGGIVKWFKSARVDASVRILKRLQQEHPEQPDDVLRSLIRDEFDREREFQKKMLERLRRDLPRALQHADPEQRRQAVRQILDRERRYTMMREEAMTERALAAVERIELQRVSPEGAFWMLSPHVKEHTLDCIAMAGKFWPHEVLKEIHPPLHHGCPCYLISLREALAAGLMTRDQIPDKVDAIARARSLYERAKAMEKAAGPAEIETYLEGLALEEARWDKRFPKGTVKAGQFAPRHVALPGVRTAIRRGLRDLIPRLPTTPAGSRRRGDGRWAWVGGRHVFVPEHRHFERRMGKHTYTSPAGSTNIYRDGKQVTEGPRAPLPLVGKADPGTEVPKWETYRKAPEPLKPLQIERRPQLDRPPENWAEWQGEAHALAHSLAEEFDAPLIEGGVVDDKEREDHSGFEDWDGNVFLGNEVMPSVVNDAKRIQEGRKATWAEMSSTYNTYRVTAHEISHTVNPADQHAFGMPGGQVLEEGLAEDVAHMILRRELARHGRQDVLDWEKANPDAAPVVGTYLNYRARINRALDRVGVPDDKRDEAILSLKFRVPPESRFMALEDMAHEYQPDNVPTVPELLDILTGSGSKEVVGPGENDPGMREEARRIADVKRDAFDRAKALGEEFDAPVALDYIHEDPFGPAFAGSYFPGERTIRVGRDVISNILNAREAKAEGRTLTEKEARDAYAGYRTLQHELQHAVNVVPAEDYMTPGVKPLAEAVNEEVAQQRVIDWLRKDGIIDVLSWVKRNPNDWLVLGGYQGYRNWLLSALDQAGVKPENRLRVVERLKFKEDVRESRLRGFFEGAEAIPNLEGFEPVLPTPDLSDIPGKADPGVPSDTRQQKAILRQSPTARKVRSMYPPGTRVEATSGAGGEGNGQFGTVERHVPMTNAQGGTLRVKWDSGHVGRVSPGSVRRAEGKADPGVGYVPDPDAPEEGEWVREPDPTGTFPQGIAVRWRQSHDALVRKALQSWKGSPTSLRIHMAEERTGAPQPDSGSAKQMRAEAAALLWEVRNKSKPNPVTLYRGTSSAATMKQSGIYPWSEEQWVADGFANQDEFGDVIQMPPGTLRGLRVADYGVNDAGEKEWLIPEGKAAVGKNDPGIGPGDEPIKVIVDGQVFPLTTWEQAASFVARAHEDGKTDVRIRIGWDADARDPTPEEQAHIVQLATSQLAGKADPGVPNAWDTGEFFHVTTDADAIHRDGYVNPRAEGETGTFDFPVDPDAVYMWPTREAAEKWIKYREMRDKGGDLSIVKVHAEVSQLEPDPEPFYNLIRNYLVDEESGDRRSQELGYRALDEARHFPNPVYHPEGQTLREWLREQDVSVWRTADPSEAQPEHIARDPWVEARGVLAKMPQQLRVDVARVFSEEGLAVVARGPRSVVEASHRVLDSSGAVR